MIIGFDAKRAFNNFTGLGNYSRTLIETLAKYYPENEYHLFTPKKIDHPRLDFIQSYPSVSVHFPTGFMRRIHPLWRSYFIANDISREKIDIFHGLSHELPLKIPKNVKTVVTIHDLIHEHYPQFYPIIDRKIYSWKFKSACEKADVVVAISEATKQDIMHFYKIEESKIKVIYQSCHPQFYTSVLPISAQNDNDFHLPNSTRSDNDPLSILNKNKHNLPKNYVLYVGTVNERKNLLGLVKSLQIIDNQLDIKLVVIGDGGDYLKKVKNYVLENHLESSVLFLSNIPFSDFPNIYRGAKALVLPSFQEGFGIPIIEALWSSCPVITSEGGCFPEAGGPDSIYINPHDSEAIAHAIERVVTDASLRERMILRGGEYVRKFHEQRIGEEWERLYRNL